MKGNQYMTNNIKTLSFNREQAENLYQDGMTNFASDDKYLKALGFFQQSVGGKTLNDKYNANVVVKDITEDKKVEAIDELESENIEDDKSSEILPIKKLKKVKEKKTFN